MQREAESAIGEIDDESFGFPAIVERIEAHGFEVNESTLRKNLVEMARRNRGDFHVAVEGKGRRSTVYKKGPRKTTF